ncbi:MAG: hypothetical protein ACRDCC_08615 [Culicoidibacterales bacterium]
MQMRSISELSPTQLVLIEYPEQNFQICEASEVENEAIAAWCVKVEQLNINLKEVLKQELFRMYEQGEEEESIIEDAIQNLTKYEDELAKIQKQIVDKVINTLVYRETEEVRV